MRLPACPPPLASSAPASLPALGMGRYSRSEPGIGRASSPEGV